MPRPRTCLLVALTLVASLVLSGRAATSHAAPVPGRVIRTHVTGSAGVNQTNPDAQATALAQQVLAGGDGAESALLTALPLAGFTVLGDDGSTVAAPTGASQGLSFGRWEVDAMLASEGAFSTSVADTASALTGTLPALNGAPLDQFLLNGLQEAAAGNNPALRFWARFIAALGEQAQPASDPLTATDPASVQLDAVQLALLTRRLAGDLYLFTLQNGTPPAVAGQSATGAVLTRLGWASALQSAPPCSMTPVEGTIMDANALGLGVGFGQLMSYLADHGLGAAEKIADVTGAANIVLAYAKLAWTMAAFTGTIQMQGDPPLVRTKEQAPATGELRQFTASVKLDLDKAQIANCLRPMLNSMGLDFSLPNGGALAGAEASWYPRQGFDQYIVEFHDNPLDQVTDQNGTTSIGIEGTGQRVQLPDSARPVLKPASVGIGVVLKPANLFQDLVDAGSVAASGPLGLVGVLPELLYRSSLTFNAVYNFQVKDWEVVRYRGEGSVDFTNVFPSNPTPGGPSSQDNQHSTFTIEFDDPGPGQPIGGTGTFSFSSTSSYQDGAYHCSAQDSESYQMGVYGEAGDGTLKLGLAVASLPQPLTCFSAVANQPRRLGLVGMPGDLFTIDDRDGAEVTVPFSMEGYPASHGTMHLTIHQLAPDEQ